MVFSRCASHAGSEFARENQYLVAGPWVHIPWGDRVGAADFGAEALLDTDAILLRWFNHWLKDSGEFAEEPRVRHFVLGENRWREAEAFRPRRNMRCICTATAEPIRAKAMGRSRQRPQSAEPCDIFVYDPEVPVLAPGGAAAQSGQFDQAALELGNNLLVYSTAPIASPTADFWHSARRALLRDFAAHTDFTAKLVRVRPERRGGIYLHRHRAIDVGFSRSRDTPRTRFIAGNSISSPLRARFAAGDRMRLEIASSAFPLYDRNPGSGVPSCRATSWDWRRSTQIVYHDREHSSALYLPV